MCVRVIDFSSVLMIIRFNFGTVLTVFFSPFYYEENTYLSAWMMTIAMHVLTYRLGCIVLTKWHSNTQIDMSLILNNQSLFFLTFLFLSKNTAIIVCCLLEQVRNRTHNLPESSREHQPKQYLKLRQLNEYFASKYICSQHYFHYKQFNILFC